MWGTHGSFSKDPEMTLEVSPRQSPHNPYIALRYVGTSCFEKLGRTGSINLMPILGLFLFENVNGTPSYTPCACSTMTAIVRNSGQRPEAISG